MKLTEIKTHIYEVDMPRKMGDANSPRGRKRSSNVILELITDEGLTGISTTGFILTAVAMLCGFAKENIKIIMRKFMKFI